MEMIILINFNKNLLQAMIKIIQWVNCIISKKASRFGQTQDKKKSYM